LIERHAAGLGHSLAEERLESITSHLTERARALELAMVQTASAPGLLAAVTRHEPEGIAAALGGGKLHHELDFLALLGADGRLVWRGGAAHAVAPGRRRVEVKLPADFSSEPLFRRVLAGEAGISYEDWGEDLVQTIVVPVKLGERLIGVLLGGTVLTGNNALCAALVDRGPAEAAVERHGRWIASGGPGGSGPGALIGAA